MTGEEPGAEAGRLAGEPGATPSDRRRIPDPVLGVRPVGDLAFLVDVVSNRQVHRLAAAVRDRFAQQLDDVVPGEETLLLCFTSRPPPLAEVTAAIRALALDPPPQPPSSEQAGSITIAVRYDGADLDTVARALGIDVERVIELHSQPEYLVAFMGFAPGFAYLTGGHPQLRLPRRDEPRPRVPAGSVAIASTYSAVYPTSAPGGWHLLGHTDAVLFDPQRNPPALLAAGRRVVFEPRQAT